MNRDIVNQPATFLPLNLGIRVYNFFPSSNIHTNINLAAIGTDNFSVKLLSQRKAKACFSSASRSTNYQKFFHLAKSTINEPKMDFSDKLLSNGLQPEYNLDFPYFIKRL